VTSGYRGKRRSRGLVLGSPGQRASAGCAGCASSARSGVCRGSIDRQKGAGWRVRNSRPTPSGHASSR
jgi:hypothetical protein